MLTFQIQQSFFYKKNLIEYMDPIPKTDYMYFKRPSLIIPFSSFYMINMLKKGWDSRYEWSISVINLAWIKTSLAPFTNTD